MTRPSDVDGMRRGILRGLSAGLVGAALLPRISRAAADPVAETRYGRVGGFVRNGVEYFLGIPYGGSASGAQRFQAPRPPKPWAGVRDAKSHGPPAYQPQGTILGDNSARPAEDCLVLNVWTPARDGRRRPVMFYNHGGGFTTGSGASQAQDGANLARHYDVVVVESNHRLGLLGYLHLADLPGARGHVGVNCGLLDIVAALGWVRDNIANFGGDPGQVMVFGESGGGSKTACLHAMPTAAPLFHRASIESAPLRMGTAETANTLTAQVLADLGIAPKDWRKLLEVPPETLIATQQKLARTAPAGALAPLAIQPFIDGVVLRAQPFDPSALSLSRDKPLIVGYNHDETVFFSLMSPDKSVFSLDAAGLRERLAPQVADVDEAIAVYRQSRPAATPTQLYIAITTALFAGNGAIRVAEHKAAQGGAAAYAYIFNYKLEGLVPGTDYPMGAMHAAEVTFKFFNMEGVTSRGSRNLSGGRPERFQAGQNMSSLWTGFARNGVPSAPGVPDWSPYTAAQRATMVIDTECKLVDDPYRIEREFWQAREVTPAA